MQKDFFVYKGANRQTDKQTDTQTNRQNKHTHTHTPTNRQTHQHTHTHTHTPHPHTHWGSCGPKPISRSRSAEHALRQLTHSQPPWAPRPRTHTHTQPEPGPTTAPETTQNRTKQRQQQQLHNLPSEDPQTGSAFWPYVLSILEKNSRKWDLPRVVEGYCKHQSSQNDQSYMALR